MTDQEFVQKYHDLEKRIKQLEAVINKIETDSEPKFEIAQDERYYFIDFYFKGCSLNVRSDVYADVLVDRARVDRNNCFKTEERAKEVLDKINLLLKLERLHDIYCPNYKPNWHEESGSFKHYVYYDTSEAKWYPCNTQIMEDAIQVYFPTDEIAQKVCDILNKEREDYDNS